MTRPLPHQQMPRQQMPHQRLQLREKERAVPASLLFHSVDHQNGRRPPLRPPPQAVACICVRPALWPCPLQPATTPHLLLPAAPTHHQGLLCHSAAERTRVQGQRGLHQRALQPAAACGRRGSQKGGGEERGSLQRSPAPTQHSPSRSLMMTAPQACQRLAQPLMLTMMMVVTPPLVLLLALLPRVLLLLLLLPYLSVPSHPPFPSPSAPLVP